MRFLRLHMSTVALTLVGLSSASLADRQPATELGEVWTATDKSYSRKTADVIQEMLIERTGDSALMKRDAHPKHHGCVKAFLRIDSKTLEPQERVGLFAHDGEEFEAWVRFSNGSPDSTKSDADADVRGMAIKVMGVTEGGFLSQAGVDPESGVHDFVMMNSPVFFIRNTKDYAGLMRAVKGSGVGLVWFMVTHPKTAVILQKARGMDVGNPLHVNYFSATPYKLGAGTMKFMARSCVGEKERDREPSDAGVNYLKDRLVRSLESDAACFEFLIQKGSQSSGMPIEDPTVAWSTKESPYIKVATLRIPKQTGVDSEAQMNFCENISFNPWRAPAENRPLGAINRARLETYGQIADLRHDHNRIPVMQPTNHEPCQGETAPLCDKP